MCNNLCFSAAGLKPLYCLCCSPTFHSKKYDGLADKIPTAVHHQKLDLDEITAVLRTRRLRWYGHVQRATSCINSITRLELPGTRDRGRPRKTWSACVKNDMTTCIMYMQPGWCQPVRQEFMENECEALPGVAYPGVRDNRSTLNTKTGYDDY